MQGGQSAQRAGTRLVRATDVMLAGGALLVFAPLLLIIMLAIRVTDPGPIFFAHRRLGRDGKPFGCLKFRTMIVNSQEVLRHLLDTDPVARSEWDRDHKLRNDPRITPLGNFLRKTSLDELPQLWNVIGGDMSIVGPRPIVAPPPPRPPHAVSGSVPAIAQATLRSGPSIVSN